jgi:hypothetical protein
MRALPQCTACRGRRQRALLPAGDGRAASTSFAGLTPRSRAPARMLCYALPMTIEEMQHETDHHRGMRGRILGSDGDGC